MGNNISPLNVNKITYLCPNIGVKVKVKLINVCKNVIFYRFHVVNNVYDLKQWWTSFLTEFDRLGLDELIYHTIEVEKDIWDMWKYKGDYLDVFVYIPYKIFLSNIDIKAAIHFMGHPY